MYTSDPIFMFLFTFVFFPLFIMNFAKMNKTQKEIVELLKEINNTQPERVRKSSAHTEDSTSPL